MKRKNVLDNIVLEPIVISGMGGRFPESDSTDEFANNLYNNVDMITEDDRRWPTGHFGMDHRMGKLKEIDKLDCAFFGLFSQFADKVDPHSRMLLETTYEAIVDAGINPQNLRGTKTGVYIGYSSFGMSDNVPEDVQRDSQMSLSQNLLYMQGSAKALYANRISFVFDFKGPSFILDTACSSSLVALNAAMNDLRLGKCNQAIVGGTQICLQAFTNQIFQSTKLNSNDGFPKVWDESANGFVRGETVCCFLLQRKSDAKRIYATVLNTGVNIDGFKRVGMFFPSSETQENLMTKVYKEVNVDPRNVNYFEAHATGTKVGDPQEAKAIYNAFCAKCDRKDPLPIGLVKSNIGHAEGASGASSVAKVLIVFENECIPASLHLKKMKHLIEPYCPPLLPIKENYKYNPKIAGVNNFGVGGVNANVLLEANYKVADDDALKIAETIPRIVNICCRTEQALNEMFDWIEKNPEKVTRDFLALLADTVRVTPSLNSSGMPYRGTMMIKRLADNKYDYKRQSSQFSLKNQRPVWFIFPGLGGQWIGMAKALMPIKTFADKIEECHKILQSVGVDLKHLLLSDDESSMSTMTNKFCATTALELALVNVLKELDITPDGIMGHSFGEIAALYADGCVTTEEALLITYYRGVITEADKDIPRGLMAVVGMSWNEMKKILPKNVHLVCNNGKDTIVVSGLEKETKQFVAELKGKGIFVRELQSSEIPYHSKYLMSSAKKMTKQLSKVLPHPKIRSKKFVSTAILESDVDESLLTASAQYFVYNLISPVYFYNKLKSLPSDAIVIEIGPHGLFSKAVKDTLESADYVSLMKKDSNDTNLETFLGSIAKLYELGVNPTIENLYPKVEWPVARGTQSIGSLIRWDHSTSHFVRKYPDFFFRSTAADMNESVVLSQTFKSFLPDHCIDGNILYPATGYLMLAWRQMAGNYAKNWNEIPVIFEDVQFRRPIFLWEDENTEIKVKYLQQTGAFSILEGGNVACFGKIRTSDQYCLCVQHLTTEGEDKKEYEVVLNRNDIYKDLKILGYDYGPKFQKLKSMKTNNFETITGDVDWDGNWITFMDSLLQTMALAMPFRKLMVPVMIKSLRCDPLVLYQAIKQNRLTDVLTEEPKKTMNDIVCEADADKFDEVQDGKVMDIFQTSDDMFEEMYAQQYHIYESVLPYHVDMNCRMVVTHGVEIEDVIAFPIPRKTNAQDLKLESYEFVANEDMNAILENEKKETEEYIKVCSSIVSKIKQKLNLKYNEVKVEASDELIDKYLSDIKEDQILLKILNELNRNCLDENQNIETNEFLTDLLNKEEYDISRDVINQSHRNEPFIRALLDIVSECNVPKKDIKVLEVNTTRSLLAEQVDSYLASFAIYSIDVNYSIALQYTDCVPETKSFRITEWKPSDSSVFPSEVNANNLIIFKDSLDLWKLDVERQLQDTYDSLLDKGFLLSIFRYQFTVPELALNQMNGKKNLKNSDLEQRIADYLSAAKSVGFTLVGTKSDAIGSMALLFRKIDAKLTQPKKENIITIESNSMNWFESVKQKIINAKDNEDKEETVWLVANEWNTGIIGLINCLRLEPGGDSIRCLLDCDNLSQSKFDFGIKLFADILRKDLPINVLKNGKLGTFRHLTLDKTYDKIESNDYFLNLGQSRDLSGFQWFDLKHLATTKDFYDFNNRLIPKVKCNIYTSGLNFRDVMLTTGRIVAGPQSLLTDCLLGLEFAGRREGTGERVMGLDISRCFATSIDAREDMITKIPDHWTMDEAVTIICTYSTVVWYGLIERAQLQRGEKILIHSAAGGVGQAAINICQHYGCDIYATVGTDDKKKFLMEKFNIPENRIFSSRTIEFKYKVIDLTKSSGSKGVDIVLNSLAGEKLDASFECVADCGRFVEIGKYDLQMNKQLGMFSFLRDISFIGVAVDQQIYLKQGFTKRFYDWMHNNCSNGMIKPITKNVFRAEEADKAFKYMTTGKHIGKIVIRIRDEEKKTVMKSVSPANKIVVTTKTYFDPNKVYIITGGLGGFGLEFIHWMLFLGARKFVLTSRYGVKSQYQKFIIDRLKSIGTKFKYFEPKIVVKTHDSNTIEGADQLIRDCQQLGPIGGIFHLALVLNDCLLENHSIDKYCETVDSKTKTFENLDKLCRELKLDLDYFVVFSSVACGRGNAGQSNYAYGNSVCERICEARHRDGLKGLAIQWGPIGDVGVLADTDINTSLASVVKQRVSSCLEIMDKLLQTNKPIVSCLIRAKRQTFKGTKEYKLVQQLWQSLNIDPKTTPNHLTLGEIGMESMFAVELQQGLEREYGIKVTLTDVKNITIGMMKEFESGKVDEMKKFANDIKECRAKMSKIKFIIPTEAHCRLNQIQTGKPLFFLPPLEGVFASLEGLAMKIDRPVIGLNWINKLNSYSSLKETNEYFIDLINQMEPNTDHDIIGHFYSVYPMIQMLKKGLIRKAVIIDIMSDNIELDSDTLSDDSLIEIILSFMTKDLPDVVVDKLKRDLQSKPDVESKLNKICDEVREFGGPGVVTKDLEQILNNSFRRAKMVDQYRLNRKKKLTFGRVRDSLGKKYLKLKGKLLVLKPSKVNPEGKVGPEDADSVKNAYLLNEGIMNQIDSETIDCDTNSGDNDLEMMSTRINNFIA